MMTVALSGDALWVDVFEETCCCETGTWPAMQSKTILPCTDTYTWAYGGITAGQECCAMIVSFMPSVVVPVSLRAETTG